MYQRFNSMLYTSISVHTLPHSPLVLHEDQHKRHPMQSIDYPSRTQKRSPMWSAHAQALNPCSPPSFLFYCMCSLTVSTLSATFLANSPTTSAQSASTGFSVVASPPTSNPDSNVFCSRSSTPCASSTRFISSTRTTARLSAPRIGSVPQRSGSCSSSTSDDRSVMSLLLPPLVLDDDDDDDDDDEDDCDEDVPLS